MDNMKHCVVCEQELPATKEYFHVASNRADGFRGECKVCRKNNKLKREVQKLEKRCTTCKLLKPNTDEFFHRLSIERGTNRSQCKVCHTASQRNSKLITAYGITLDEYDRMYTKQNGCCFICKDDFEKFKLVIDHNHITGKVRSLLCSNCNTGLGMFKENKNTLLNAIKYIDHHGE